MTKTRRLIIELIDSLAFAAIFYAIFATIIRWLTHEYMSVSQTAYFAALVAANFCMRRVCFTNWFSRKPRPAKPTKDARLGGSRDLIGEAYKPATTVTMYIGLKLMVTHLLIQLVLAVILFSTGMETMWFILVLSVVMSGHSVWLALRKKALGRMPMIVATAVIFVALSFWMASLGNWFLVSLYTLLMLFVAAGRLIVVHMIKVDNSLKAAESSSQQSIGKILSFNYKLLGGFALAFSGIVVAAYFALMRPVLVAIANFFERLPAFERGELSRDDYLGPAITGYGSSEMALLLQFEHMNPSRTSRIAIFLMNLVFGALAIAVLLVVIYSILRVLLRWLNLRSVKVAESEPLADIEDEKEFIGLNKTRRTTRANKARNEHPMRRLFRETVRKHIKMGVPIKNTDTPTEMTVRVHDRDFDNLANEYSRVRYSSDGSVEHGGKP